MIPVRYTTTPCSKEPISIPELDNGEGSSSMGQRRASSPVPNNNQIANDELVSNHLQDTELFDFDLFHDEFGPTQGFPVIVNFDGGDECSNGGPAVEVPGRFDGNSCLGKGKGIDLGLGMNCELSKEYQDGHRAGFEQGKSYGYRTGWNKGHISGYSAGMKAAEEGYAQLREFQVSSAFNDCGI
ncbi:hypothetical protein DL95DRAFT_66884 [Leptodontidium sp. 2 PMI_412]|nr:hypothetical protein DL95DRAFT_66884 [Leptodontidium sp. 2 PMI_412]